MNFAPISLTLSSGTVTFNPYDRGAKGAFVYRESAKQLHAQRLVVSTETRDDANDRYVVQLNTPMVMTVAEGCCPVPGNPLRGTDVVKAELKFGADTTEAERKAQIDLLIASVLEFKTTMAQRGKIYAN